MQKELTWERQENLRLIEVLAGMESLAAESGDEETVMHCQSGIRYAIGDADMPLWLDAVLREMDGEESPRTRCESETTVRKSGYATAMAVFDEVLDGRLLPVERESARSDFGSALMAYECGLLDAEEVLGRLPQMGHREGAYARYRVREAL